jgi:hypothetical protein
MTKQDRIIPPAQCRSMRNKLNAKAREEDKEGNRAEAQRFQTMAQNFVLMASDKPEERERGRKMLEKNERYWRDFTTHSVRHPDEIKV